MNITKSLRARHQVARDRRALARAIADAPSPSMHAELIIAQQRYMNR